MRSLNLAGGRQLPYALRTPEDHNSITMLYRKLTALALFTSAVTAAPLTAASKQSILTPEDDDSRATHTSSITGRLSAVAEITHEWDAINRFTGPFTEEYLKGLRGDQRVQPIEEDGSVNATTLVTQYVVKPQSQPRLMTFPAKTQRPVAPCEAERVDLADFIDQLHLR